MLCCRKCQGSKSRQIGNRNPGSFLDNWRESSLNATRRRHSRSRSEVFISKNTGSPRNSTRACGPNSPNRPGGAGGIRVGADVVRGGRGEEGDRAVAVRRQPISLGTFASAGVVLPGQSPSLERVCVPAAWTWYRTLMDEYPNHSLTGETRRFWARLNEFPPENMKRPLRSLQAKTRRDGER